MKSQRWARCRASSRPGRLLGVVGALCTVLTVPLASAQGIYPGELSKEGYKLAGGFEPVLQLRTYYFDQESLTGSPSQGWALGGWAGLRSPWWGDVLQVGFVGYTSQILHGPSDKDGTKLFRPGPEPINVLGEAFAAVRVLGQTVTGYRQLIDRPFIGPQDSRMVPNTFEAYTLTGSVEQVSYTGGYITKKKNRDSEGFVWMSDIAGAKGSRDGVVYAGATWNFARNGTVRVDEQYAVDLFNTFYVDGKYAIPFDDKTALTLGAQYFPQRSVGQARIGSFSTYGVGLQAAVTSGALGGQLYYTQTGKGYDTQAPFGGHASYLSLMASDFNTAGEKAWGLGANVNFAELGAPGLSASAIYAASSGRINFANGSAVPDRNELDLRADYAFGKGTVFDGLVATLRYAWLHQDGSPQTQTQLRAILNYTVKF